MILNCYQNDSMEAFKLNSIQLEMKAQIESKIASGHYSFSLPSLRNLFN